MPFRLLLLPLICLTFAFGQWAPIGPDGGSAHVLAMDPQNASHLLAGSRNLPLYESLDAGGSWHVLGDFGGIQEMYQDALNVVAIDPRNPQTFYAGISAINTRPGEGNGAGIYKSLNAGKSWTRIPSIAGISVYCLAIWEKDPHFMAAGTNHGVYRSRDSGESWESISPAGNRELQGVMSIAIDPRNSDMIYAGTPHLPWKTADGGKQWRSIHTGMSDDSDVFSIRIDRQNSERVYASACSGIYGSLSGGTAWTKLQGIPFTNRRTHVIAQDPRHPATLYAATTLGLWKSTTRGAEWHHNSEDSINALVLDPKGVMYLAVDQRGLLKSEDGGQTFHEINHGYVARDITTMQPAGDPGHPFLYASTVYDGRWGGLFRTADGIQWELLANEEALHGQNLTSFAALAGSSCLVGASYEGFLRSKNDGQTWMEMVSRKAPNVEPKPGVPKGRPKAAARAPVARPKVPLTFPSPNIHIYSLKASSGKMPYLIAATSAGLFYTVNGDEWRPMRIPAPANLTLSTTAVFVSPGDSGNLAAKTSAGLYISHDGGATWQGAALQADPDINEIAFDYVDPNLVVAATSLGIYKSADGGRTWEFHLGGLPRDNITAVIFHPTHHAEAYALDRGWIYRSVDGGVHWVLFDRTGLDNVTFSTIAFGLSNSNPQLYGLTKLRGIFVYPAVPAKQPGAEPANVPPHPHTAFN